MYIVEENPAIVDILSKHPLLKKAEYVRQDFDSITEGHTGFTSIVKSWKHKWTDAVARYLQTHISRKALGTKYLTVQMT